MELNTKLLSKLWSIQNFKDPDIDFFAQQQLAAETQQGLKVMSTLLILLVLVAMLLFKQMSLINSFSLNYFWVIALAVHINVSARVVSEIKTLHALGMTLLVISATAYVFIAHQTGGFNSLLLANIVLLFMVIPLVPWGLREAIAIVLSIYMLLTLSTISVGNRFDNETLKVLQFFLIAAGATSLILVIRSTLLRKQELIARFKLQKAHAELFTLSNIDPLTGAWNRRYTDNAVHNLVKSFSNRYRDMQFVVFDLDNFKELNDTFGHDFGDRVLMMVCDRALQEIGEFGYLIRIGGDEFVLLLVGIDAEAFMQKLRSAIVHEVRQDRQDAKFDLSWGVVTIPLAPLDDSEKVFRKADQELYTHKKSHRSISYQGNK